MEDTIQEIETMNGEGTSDDALIEELCLEAESALEPGDISDKEQTIIHRGDEEAPVPIRGKVSSAGYVKIYNTRTGDVSLTNRNMLNAQLRKRFPDGDKERVYTTRPMALKRAKGAYLCMLHKDSPNRDLYERLGLPDCRKSNLTSPFQVARHMQKRHPMEWQAIETERLSAEKQQELDWRESQTQMMKQMAQANKTALASHKRNK